MNGGGYRPRAVTFDFGNTLVPFKTPEHTRIMHQFHLRFILTQVGDFSYEQMEGEYHRLRDMQTRVNLPLLRENDMVARLRDLVRNLSGQEPPQEMVRAAVDCYAEAVVESLQVPEYLVPFLSRLNARYPLAIISNYPLAEGIFTAVDRFGLAPFFRSVVVSAEVGHIKPHPSPFLRAARDLGVPVEETLHVGDNWWADIIGAAGVGAASAYIRQHLEIDHPDYGKAPGQPLFELDHLLQLDDWIA